MKRQQQTFEDMNVDGVHEWHTQLPDTLCRAGQVVSLSFVITRCVERWVSLWRECVAEVWMRTGVQYFFHKETIAAGAKGVRKACPLPVLGNGETVSHPEHSAEWCRPSC